MAQVAVVPRCRLGRTVFSRPSVLSVVALLLLLARPAHAQQAPSRYDAAIDSARAIIAQGMRNNQIPGLSVAVAVNGRVVWSEARGMASVEPPVPASPATLFRIGSVSKALTAAALMRLREAGRINLSDSVRRYVPEFPARHPAITVRQLAGHLSGIRHYRGSEFTSRVRYDSVVGALTVFSEDSLLFRPGSRFAYTTYGYSLLSAVIERAAGMRFIEYVASEVLRPLGLRETVPDFADSVFANRATFYYREPDRVIVAPQVDQSNKWAGGGYLSTAEEMVRFGSALLAPGFLGTESLRHLFEPAVLEDGKATGYGMGWFVASDSLGHRVRYHGGSSVGGTAMLSMHPEQRIVVALLVNTTASRFVNTTAERLAHLFGAEAHAP